MKFNTQVPNYTNKIINTIFKKINNINLRLSLENVCLKIKWQNKNKYWYYVQER